MGTGFFKGRGGATAGAPPKIGSIQGGNLFARSIASPGYAAHSFAGTANKDLGMVQAVAKAGAFKKSVRGSAYAPGPKKV